MNPEDKTQKYLTLSPKVWAAGLTALATTYITGLLLSKFGVVVDVGTVGIIIGPPILAACVAFASWCARIGEKFLAVQGLVDVEPSGASSDELLKLANEAAHAEAAVEPDTSPPSR